MKSAYLWPLLQALGLLAGQPTRALAQCTPAVVTAFPYAESFDGVAAPALPCGVAVADVNNDAKTWATIGNTASSAPNAMCYTYSATNTANDWFFTPGLWLRQGYRYQVQFKYRAAFGSYPERLEVKLGTAATPAGQTTTLFSNTSITNTTYTTTTAGTGAGQVASFLPAATGTYYVGFHAISAANKFYLYVDDVSVTEAAPLPVQLIDFEAQAAGPAAVRLAWATASEAGSARFDIERSPDGAVFTKIGEVPAAGNSLSPRPYAWLDAAPPTRPGPRYYRLRQIDLDGTAAYSPVRSVARAAGAEVAIYPNPTTGLTTFECPAATTLTVRDALGRACRVLPLPAGPSALDLSALPAGLYTLTGPGLPRPLRLVRE